MKEIALKVADNELNAMRLAGSSVPETIKEFITKLIGALSSGDDEKTFKYKDKTT